MPTIPLVDDDRNILTSVSIALEAEGYRITTYTDDGEELSPPHGLISDWAPSSFASHVSLYGRMGYALPFTYRRSGGHHGEGADAQQQRKEEAEAGEEQEESRRSVRQNRHLVREPIRQEALAGDHRARPPRALYDDRANVSGLLRDQVRR